MSEMQTIEALFRKHEQANNEVIDTLVDLFEYAQSEEERDKLLEELQECYRQRDEAKAFISICMDMRQMGIK